MKEENNMNLVSLQKTIGYVFKDKSKLENALTHVSFSNENRGVKSNERLEFLGDAILEYSISDYLYRKYPNMDEGEMTRKRANIVCEKSLAVLARKFEISNYIKFGQCELNSNDGEKTAIIADAIEAIIGAIYLDSDIITVREYIITTFNELITESDDLFHDYKTMLQEKLQKHGTVDIKYELLSETGPDHNKKYESCVKLNGKQLGIGIGKNKKESEQMAAKEALGVKDEEK